jgi:2-isopropylmalate synthase
MREEARQLRIADTTLRDGAQTIGCHFTPESKIQVAEQLIGLGLDVIELGTPIASPDELDVAKVAAKKFCDVDVTLSAFARAKEIDIEVAYEGIGSHPQGMLAMLTSVSDIHIDAKFKKTREQMLKAFVKQVKYAKEMGFKKLMVYLEDGTRTNYDDVKALVDAFFEAGADVISIPDTVGYVNDPNQYGEMFSRLIKDLGISQDQILSAHTHNDKGLAVANALSAIRHGAGQVECTINGLGERAGNASLSALLLNLYTEEAGRWCSMDYGVKTKIQLSEVAKVSKLVGDLSGMGINYNEPLMGNAVCTTAAGIHQDGVLKNKKTYFCYAPEDYGISMENRYLSFSIQSGMKGITDVHQKMGLNLDKAIQQKIYEQVILLAQQKNPSLEDIRAITMDVVSEKDPVMQLKVCRVESGVSPCSAEVVLNRVEDGVSLRGIGYGDGPFAAFTDICCELLDIEAKILDYHDIVVGEGRESQMQAYVKVDIGGQHYVGRGVSTDIVLAGCRAFMKCANEYLRGQKESAS